MFGTKPKHCLICLEKEARISDLKSQIEMLREMVYPKKVSQDLSTTDKEVDGLFNDLQSDSSETNLDIMSADREAQLLLSGDYDGIHEV